MQLLTYRGAEPRAMMQRIIAEQGSTARVISLKEGRYGGILGFFAKQGFILTVEIDEKVRMSNVHRPLSPTEPVIDSKSSPAPRTPPTTEELIAQLVEQTEDIFEIKTTTALPQTFDDALESVTASLGADPIAFAQEWADLNRTSEVSSTCDEITPLSLYRSPLNPPSSNSSTATSVPVAVESNVDEGGEIYMRLRTAGYPLTLLAELMGAGVGSLSLEHAFSIVHQIPKLPRTAGSLVAIVGPSERAIELGTQIATELQMDPSEVAIVTTDATFVGSNPLPEAKTPTTRQLPASLARSPQRAATTTRKRTVTKRPSRPPFGPGLVAHDVEAARDLVSGWRRDRVGVVVVACDASVTTYPWVRSVLHATMPSFVYLAARATTKNDDIRQAAYLIGGADAILLDGLNESMTPLSALGLEIPIARLNGEVADPKVWASVVSALPTTPVNY